METAITEDRFTIEEVATELRVSIKTVRDYLYEGRIKGYKIGKRYYFTRNQIQAFIDSTETNYPTSKEKEHSNASKINT